MLRRVGLRSVLSVSRRMFSFLNPPDAIRVWYTASASATG